jgi:hypothetical protein
MVTFSCDGFIRGMNSLTLRTCSFSFETNVINLTVVVCCLCFQKRKKYNQGNEKVQGSIKMLKKKKTL